jgi:hypothetical protein
MHPINTDALKMTGMRNEQPESPLEGNKTKIKPKVQEDLKKKLDLPSKKPETVGGAQMKQGGTGKAVGDTPVNNIIGKVLSLKTLDIPEKPA